jgi:hypothetical protein
MSDTKHTPEPWELKTTAGSDHTLCTIYSSKAGRGIARHVLPEDASRIVACVNACAGIPTEDLERGHVSVRQGNVPHMAHLWSDGIYRSHPEPGLAEIMEQRDMHRNAEMEWERAMMAAIGEDGPKSVSEAIAKLKAERDELLAALKTIYNRHLNPGPATGVDAIFCFRRALAAIDKAEKPPCA